MVFAESRLKDLYRQLVWGPYRRGLGRLPAGWELRANRGLGRLAWRATHNKRAAVEANLLRAFPDRDPTPIVRQVFETHFVDQYISWVFARLAAGDEAAYLEIDGLDHLDAALNRGGVVLMHPHMGPAQLPLCALGARGYRVHQVGGGGVALPMSAEGRRVTELRHALERRHIPGRIWDGRGYLRPLLRVLSQGEIVLTACDATGGGEEIGRRLFRRVLGQRMALPVGPCWLALRSGATLLPMATFRDGERYRTRIEAPETIKDLEEGADLSARWLERWLSEHPGDWHFWDEFEPGRLLE